MRAQRIEDLIRKNFPRHSRIDLVDESHMHAGRQGQESHFKLLVVSDDFLGKSRVQRQRQVNELMAEEFNSGLHALSQRLLTEEEFQKQQSDFQSPDCQGSNH